MLSFPFQLISSVIISLRHMHTIKIYYCRLVLSSRFAISGYFYLSNDLSRQISVGGSHLFRAYLFFHRWLLIILRMRSSSQPSPIFEYLNCFNKYYNLIHQKSFCRVYYIIQKRITMDDAPSESQALLYLSNTGINEGRKMLTSLEFLNARACTFYLDIDISSNFLTDISHIRSYCFTNLINLNLSINMIQSIEPLQSAKFPSLQKLYLFGNEIIDIEPLQKAQMKQLKELRLGFSGKGNNIQSIDSLIKTNFTDLQQLCLDSNDITTIKQLQFCPFSSLNLLYLANNNISSVQSSIFNRISSLKVFSIRQNQIISLRFSQKCYLPLLEYLNVSKNFITQFTSSLSTAYLKSLWKFNIKENQIAGIDSVVKCDWPNASQILYSGQAIIYRSKISGCFYEKFLAAQR